MKTCTKCCRSLPLIDFHLDKSRSDGYRNVCKKCITSYMKSYYAANRDRVMAKVLKWIGENRDRHNAKCSRWAKLNGGKVNARTARRYASKTRATPIWVRNDIDSQWLINEIYELAHLRTKMTNIKWEVDHAIPLRGADVCGLHTPFNLRVVPMALNRRKSNKQAGNL